MGAAFITEWLANVAAWSLPAFGLLLLAAQVAARELGYAIGRRRSGEEHRDEGVTLFVGSILGLVAFVLALNLSIATTRTAERRIGTLEEANAIGTAWLQSNAIGGVHGEAVAGGLERYLALRRAFVVEPYGSPRIAEIVAETNALQTEIWGHVTGLVRDQPSPVTASLMNAINHTFDMTTAQRFAMRYTLPSQLVVLLLGVTCLALGAVGYQLGQIGRPHRWLALLMTLVWTAVILEIIDMGAGRIGDQRADPFAYDWTAEGMGQGAPPGP